MCNYSNIFVKLVSAVHFLLYLIPPEAKDSHVWVITQFRISRSQYCGPCELYILGKFQLQMLKIEITTCVDLRAD